MSQNKSLLPVVIGFVRSLNEELSTAGITLIILFEVREGAAVGVTLPWAGHPGLHKSRESELSTSMQ